MTSAHFAVVGQGSVAAAAGWVLQGAGEGFYSFGRRGLTLWTYQFDASGTSKNVSALLPASDAYVLSSVRTVLVCVKAYDLLTAFDHLSLFPESVTVLPFVNGYVDDILECAKQRFPKHVFRQAVATVGISRTSAGFSLRSRGGRYQFGSLAGEEAPATECELHLCSLRQGADVAPTFAWRNDVQLLVRRKWLFNTVINSLTAVRRFARNGDLLSDLPTLAAVFAEAWDLCTGLWGEFPAARSQVYADMLRLIEDTANNENSMATDVRLGRKTENAYLAGLSAKFPGNFPLLEAMSAALSGQ